MNSRFLNDAKSNVKSILEMYKLTFSTSLFTTSFQRWLAMPAPPSHFRKNQDEDEDDQIPTASEEDIERPKGLQNFADAPFGGLCSLYDALESANREGHKKPGYKGNLIAKFFQVSLSYCLMKPLKQATISALERC